MTLLSTLATLACVAAPQSDPQFAEPIRLMAEKTPLGIQKLYPSPRHYDIDRDGSRELVIADLFGHVNVAEKTGSGPAAWGPLEPFMSGKRALKFNNW